VKLSSQARADAQRVLDRWAREKLAGLEADAIRPTTRSNRDRSKRRPNQLAQNSGRSIIDVGGIDGDGRGSAEA
jgi:hypothetical protein